MGSLWKRIVP